MTSHKSNQAPSAPVSPAKNSPKTRILAAARELFFSKGVAAVTTDMLVKKAKTSKMTLYKYFANKDEIFEQVVSADVHRLFQPLDIEITSLEVYRSVVFHFFENLVDIVFDPEIVRFDQLMISQALTHSDLTQNYFNRTYQPTIDRVESLILQGQKAGYISDHYCANRLTDMLISSVSGMHYTKALHGFDNPHATIHSAPSQRSEEANTVKAKISDILEITLGLSAPT